VASPRELLRASKRLSFILRHDPHSVGLTLDDAGWVDVEELLVGAGPQGHSVPVDLDWRGRHHVHPSADVETATAGHLFYRSDNGVWLTELVPPAYLTLLENG